MEQQQKILAVRQAMETALLTMERPSEYFRDLRKKELLKPCFLELEALIGVQQDPIFHPEGDVWEHTMLTLDRAANWRREAVEPLPFMLSALCHDFGKPAAWQMIDGRIRALGHEKQGIVPTETFLQRLGYAPAVQAYVINMVELHMRPNMLAAQKSSQKAVFRLFRRALCPEDLLLLAKADHMSRPDAYDYEQTQTYLRGNLINYRETE